jgi:hypothetical protein
MQFFYLLCCDSKHTYIFFWPKRNIQQKDDCMEMPDGFETARKSRCKIFRCIILYTWLNSCRVSFTICVEKTVCVMSEKFSIYIDNWNIHEINHNIGVLDTTLCDNVCLTCDRSVVFSGYSVC